MNTRTCPPPSRARWLGAWAALAITALAGPAWAHATDDKPAAAMAAGDTVSALRLVAEPAPIAARYRVSVTNRQTPAAAAPVVPQFWHFYRDAERVALLKGPIDEIWHRDAQGRLSFERVFHGDQRAVDYPTGELATLGVQADWTALSSFAEPAELAALRVVSRTGPGAGERLRLSGKVGGDRLTVDWLPALQLPARLERTSASGRTSRIELTRHAAAAPSDWPQPGLRSADYLRLDAADFGDMDYDPVVRKSEALDIRIGWRKAHAHD